MNFLCNDAQFYIVNNKIFMRPIFPFIAFILVATIFSSCKKNDNTTNNTGCIANATTVRQINNAQATVKINAGKFYIFEQGTIDTRLNPCFLATEFQVDNLQVIISGEVKLTQRVGNEPCCTEDFMIIKITR